MRACICICLCVCMYMSVCACMCVCACVNLSTCPQRLTVDTGARGCRVLWSICTLSQCWSKRSTCDNLSCKCLECFSE